MISHGVLLSGRQLFIFCSTVGHHSYYRGEEGEHTIQAEATTLKLRHGQHLLSGQLLKQRRGAWQSRGMLAMKPVWCLTVECLYVCQQPLLTGKTVDLSRLLIIWLTNIHTCYESCPSINSGSTRLLLQACHRNDKLGPAKTHQAIADHHLHSHLWCQKCHSSDDGPGPNQRMTISMWIG